MAEFSPTGSTLAQAQRAMNVELSDALQLNAHEQGLIEQAYSPTWANWSVSTLSGGERSTAPVMGDDRAWVSGDAMPFFARESTYRGITALDFNVGELALKMDAMYHGDTAAKERFGQASKALASFLYEVGASVQFSGPGWERVTPPIPQTILKSTGRDRANIMFPGDHHSPIPIAGPLHNIVTYGPGLSSSTLSTELLGNIKTLHYVSGGKSAHFVNKYLDLSHRLRSDAVVNLLRTGSAKTLKIPADIDPRTVRPAEGYFYNDGIAASSARFGKKERVDAVIMSSVHTAGVDECKAGIDFSAKHLRAGGTLIIKAPDISLGDEAGLDHIMSYAVNALGAPAVAGACGLLQQTFDQTAPLDRPASFAVFHK